MLIFVRFAALILTSLTLGISFARVLEMPAKLAFPPDLYVALQNSLYVAFAPPNVGAFVEPAAILAVLILAYRVRRRRPAFWLAVGTAFCLLLAFPVVFFIFTEPASAAFQAARPAAVPAEFAGYRSQWEYSHAARFILHLAGFGLLALSVLIRSRVAHSELSPYTGGAIRTDRARSYSSPSPS